MKILVINIKLGPFLVAKWAIFAQIQLFGPFLRNCTSDLSKTLPETGDSCFESFNGSVVSRKIPIDFLKVVRFAENLRSE